MVRNMTVARELGFLKVPENTLIDLKQIDDYRDDEVLIISTGSQGEPLSALSRISNHEHPIVRAGKGDVVLLASSLIPGNENSVYRVINGLARNGVSVVHKGNALVHVSGHASAGELLYCYNLLKPRNVLPVHGEIRHLIANADLAVQTGVPRDRALVAEDGAVIDLAKGKARLVGRLECGYIFVDGSTVGDIGDAELTDRKILGEEGFISVVVVVNLHAGTLVSGPDIHARGFAEDDSVFADVRGQLIDALHKAMADGVEDTFQLQQLVRRIIGRWVNTQHRRRPMILPVVVAT
jgi:ribonuclease J